MRPTRVFIVVCVGSLGLALLAPPPACATWPTDPLVNLPVCTAIRDQQQLVMASNGAGAAVFAWVDARRSANDIYAQQTSASGEVLWSTDGVPVCTADGGRAYLSVVPDGTGGAIITWLDLRTTDWDIYAQRLSADGTPLWTTDGVLVLPSAGSRAAPVATSDGQGGAIVTWQDTRTGLEHIYAQRVSAAGTPVWADTGVALCTAPPYQSFPSIISDEAGGAIVVWPDDRPDSAGLYAQRVTGEGSILWTHDGVHLSSITPQGYALAPDGAGGALVAWNNWNATAIYAQRISAAGGLEWTADGLDVCTLSGTRWAPRIVSVGAGGGIITWQDYRDGAGRADDVFAQRISSDGTPQWTADGVAICVANGYQGSPRIVSDEEGGAVITWPDLRRGTSQEDIYSQRISTEGVPLWATNGVPLCTAPGYRVLSNVISDGLQGLIAGWEDDRLGQANTNIYTQRMNGLGLLGTVDVPAEVPTSLSLDPVRPNPLSGSALVVHFTLSSAAAASLEILDVAGRRIASREVGSMGQGRHAFDPVEGRHLAPGLYLVRLRQGAHARVVRAVVLE